MIEINQVIKYSNLKFKESSIKWYRKIIQYQWRSKESTNL